MWIVFLALLWGGRRGQVLFPMGKHHDLQLFEMIPDDLQRLHRVPVGFPFPLREDRKHRRLV